MSGEFEKMKKLWHQSGNAQMELPPQFACDPTPAAATLTRFAPFLFRFALGALYVKVNRRGTGRVTAINEEGIRVEFYDGPGKGDYDWIHYKEDTGEFVSNYDAGVVTLERQA